MFFNSALAGPLVQLTWESTEVSLESSLSAAKTGSAERKKAKMICKSGLNLDMYVFQLL